MTPTVRSSMICALPRGTSIDRDAVVSRPCAATRSKRVDDALELRFPHRDSFMGTARTRPGFEEQIGGTAAPAAGEGTTAALHDAVRAPAITHLAGGAAFVVDRDLRYLVADGEALRVAGLSPQDVVGRNLSE